MSDSFVQHEIAGPPRLAAILASSCSMFTVWVFPPPRDLSPGGAAFLGVFAVSIACLVAAVVMMAVSFRRDGTLEWYLGDALRAAADAAWIPPLFVLLRSGSSLATIAAGSTAAIVATMAWGMRVCAAESSPGRDPAMFSLLPAQRWAVEVLIAAVTLESAGLAVIAGKPLLACIFVSAGTAAVAWRWAAVSGPAARAPLARTSTEFAVTVLMTSILTFAGLMPYIKLQTTRLDGFSKPVLPGSETSEGTPPKPGDLTVNLGDIYAGVIVWPEESSKITVVAPIPNLARSWPSLDRPVSVSIPFFGAYWFLRAPDRVPPPNSIIIRGSPAERSFRATDHRPLVMEAHQNLGVEVDANCCRGIDVSLRNSDRYPGTVTLELFIVNTRQPQSPHQSLGILKVQSRASWRRGMDQGGGVVEILSFAMPSGPAIRKFDQISMRFHLDRFRGDRSARIAIERFILVPRGA